MEFDDNDYEQDVDVKPGPARRRKRTRRRANLFIDAEAGDDGHTSGDKRSDKEIDNLDRFIGTDNVKY